MLRTKLYALTVLALLAMGAIVSVQADNGGIIAPRPDPNGTGTFPGGGYDSPPIPVSPPCGSKGQNSQPELVVEAPFAERYNFRVYRDDSHMLVAETYTANPSWVVTVPTPGLPVGTYSWTCRANAAGAWSEFFDPYWAFTIYKSEPPMDPPTPTPVSPACGSKGVNPNPELVVTAAAGVEMLHFCVYSGETHHLVAEAYTHDTNWVVTTLQPGLDVGTYDWTCQALYVYGIGWSQFFEPRWTFEIEKFGPPASDGVVGGSHVFDPTIQPRTYPNPFPDHTHIRMVLPRSTTASAAVYSTEGRLVRRLNLSRGPNGVCEFQWDGRDGAGRRVGAGTYLCQVTAGDMHKVVELIKSR